MNDASKPAWKRPENWAIYGILAVVGYLLLPFAANAMTLIRTVLEQGFIGILYLIGIATIVAVAMSQDFHKLIWLAYKSSIKWMTNKVYRIFPIEIMEDYIVELKGKQTDLKGAIGNLRGQLRKIEDMVRKKQEEHTRALKLAQQAHARKDQAGMQMEFSLQARKAGRLEKSKLTYQGLINTLKRLVSMMEKVLEATTYMIADLEDTVGDEKEKRATAHEAFRAMKAAKAILASDQRRADFDAALEANNEDYFEKMGLVEQFSEETQTVFNTLDLEQGIYDADALEKLEALGQQVTDKLLQGGTGKTKYRIDPALPALTDGDLELTETQGREKMSSYADLFDKT